jgi:hypothetical protein
MTHAHSSHAGKSPTTNKDVHEKITPRNNFTALATQLPVAAAARIALHSKLYTTFPPRKIHPERFAGPCANPPQFRSPSCL